MALRDGAITDATDRGCAMTLFSAAFSVSFVSFGQTRVGQIRSIISFRAPFALT
jgi:hypothetical protein